MMTFDIETRPCSMELLREIAPPFDPDAVALGNVKVQAKVDAKIAAAEESYYPKMLAKSALDPGLGRIVCVAYCSDSKGLKIEGTEKDEDEVEILRAFWEYYEVARRKAVNMVGFCCKSFDLPWLVKRSMILNVKFPYDVVWREQYKAYDLLFKDLKIQWDQGVYGKSGILDAKLDTLFRVFGLPTKPGTGEFFYKLWDTEREKAIEYVTVESTSMFELAKRMQVT